MPRLTETGRLVLLAEDEPLVAAVIAELLSDLGYLPVVAATGPEAIAAVRSDREFDLVVTDFSMPGATGREVVAAVRDRYPTLPVLYVTGYDAADVLADVHRDAHLQILQKPFGAEGLKEAITALAM
ncbi:hypothetical protein CAL29_28020 [Bordetella genomosp. 10]|uniref:Response regulatory domain-containing protein n=1 Tax=Bordetella genomosp. 10 TaxID=1416804 RepID=A0A261S5L2_9BORD|nr:response regulator [Bordetella genomosp. 10]OZI31723.1 hypothetical protein CAL29_28020 [Bordetella genomosp. 10]